MNEFEEGDEEDEILLPTHGILNPEWMFREIVKRASPRMIVRGMVGLSEYFWRNHPFQGYGSDEVADVIVQYMFTGTYTSPIPEDSEEEETQITEEEVERFTQMLEVFSEQDYTDRKKAETEEGDDNND